MEFKLPVTHNHLSLQHDFRFQPLPPTHPLWLYYLPLRSLIAERMLSELPPPNHEVIIPIKGPGYRKTSAKYNISRVLNALDALVLYTPESVVSLRKRHLNELFTTTNYRINGIADSERKVVHWFRLAEMVHVVHKGTKAACTRAGSAQSSLVTTPKLIETSEESRLADLSEDFIKLSMESPNDDNDMEKSVDSVGVVVGVVEKTTIAIITSKQSSRIRNLPARFGFAAPQSKAAFATIPQSKAAFATINSFKSHPVSKVKSATTSDDTESDNPDPGDETQRSTASIGQVKKRDGQRCVVTYSCRDVQAAHIIPFSCGNFSEYYTTHYYWIFLRILLGSTVAKATWDFVGGSLINRLENMFCLSISVHSWFGQGSNLLIPVDETGPETEDMSKRRRLVLQLLLLDDEYNTPTVFPKFVSDGPGLGIPKSRLAMQKTRLSKARILDDEDLVVMYTEDPRTMPLPSRDLLAVFANVSGVVSYIKREERRQKENEGRADKGGKETTQDHAEEDAEADKGEDNEDDNEHTEDDRDEDCDDNNDNSDNNKEHEAPEPNDSATTTRSVGNGRGGGSSAMGEQGTSSVNHGNSTRFSGYGDTPSSSSPETRTLPPTSPEHPAFSAESMSPLPALSTGIPSGSGTASTSTNICVTPPTQQAPSFPSPQMLNHKQRGLNLDLLNQKLAPYARGLRVRTREEMRWIKGVQRCCMQMTSESASDDEGDGVDGVAWDTYAGSHQVLREGAMLM